MADDLVQVYKNGDLNTAPLKVPRSRLKEALADGYHPDPGFWGAAWEGVKQGATFNFGDELAGVAAKFGAATVGGVDPSFKEDAYTQARDEARQATTTAYRTRPGATLTGAVGGGALTAFAPGLAPLMSTRATGAKGIAAAAAKNAGVGAVQGLGGAEDLENPIGDVLTGAAIGAGAGVGGQVLARAAPAAGRVITDRAKNADRMRLLTAEGATGGSIANPRILESVEGRLAGQPPVKGKTPEAARVMREYGMAPAISTTGGVLQRAEGVAETAAAAKEALVRAVTEQATKQSGASTFAVPAKRVSDYLRASADELLADSPNEAADVVRALRLKAAQIEQGPAMLSVDQAIRSAQLAGQLVSKWGNEAPVKQFVAQQTTRGYREAVDDVAEEMLTQPGASMPPEVDVAMGTMTKAKRLGGAPKETLQELRKVEQVARKVADASERSLGRQGKNRMLGLTDLGVGEIAAASGGAPAAAVAIGGRKLAGEVGASVRATAAEKAAALVAKAQRHPQLVAGLGELGAWLARAAQAGPQGLIIQHQILRVTDPDLARQVDQLLEQPPAPPPDPLAPLR